LKIGIKNAYLFIDSLRICLTHNSDNNMANEPKKKVAAKKVATKKVAIKTATVAVKKTAIKVAAVKKANLPKPAAVKKPAVRKVASKKPTSATALVAKVDAGFGNTVYIRGDGPGMSWEQGVVLENISATEWKWSNSSVKTAFECKLLLNDELWASGENITVLPGATLVVEPAF
jgi:hypothetical protein